MLQKTRVDVRPPLIGSRMSSQLDPFTGGGSRDTIDDPLQEIPGDLDFHVNVNVPGPLTIVDKLLTGYRPKPFQRFIGFRGPRIEIRVQQFSPCRIEPCSPDISYLRITEVMSLERYVDEIR